MSKRPATVRRVTAPTKEALSTLAEILYDFLPLTACSKNAVTFTSIFAASGVAEYLSGPDNKRQALEAGFTEVYRRHERLPRSILRKVVPAAVAYRRHSRRPLTREEVDRLTECLARLGIDMAAELGALELDETIPRVGVPPQKLQQALRQHDLEPEIGSEPLQLYEDGHFNEAVRKAAERFEAVVQALAGLDTFGRDLMAKAFAASDHLAVDRLQPENQAGFLEGYRFLAMGSVGAIRNVFSHGDEERRSPEECLEMLLFLNWMLRALKRT